MDFLQDFIQLIAKRTGLYVREKDQQVVRQIIEQRMRILNLTSASQYYQFLQESALTAEGNSPAQNEWRILAQLLTNTESYFFRDRGQFALLREKILPQLIAWRRAQQQQEGSSRPSLRLWSAGCAGGEEPYSLAILLWELLPDLPNWDLLVLGTDINQNVLQKAKIGIYGDWSFRLTSERLQKRYFHYQQTGWKLDDKIRNLVTFRYGNLVRDRLGDPASYASQMDLILCRNVFIYFQPEAIGSVLKKFYNTLRERGYLLTAHTELYGQDLSPFRVRIFPESIAYQRCETPTPETSAPPLPPPSVSFVQWQPPSHPRSVPKRSLPKKNTPHRQPLSQQHPKTTVSTPENSQTTSAAQTQFSQAETLLQQGYYRQAIAKAEAYLEDTIYRLPAHTLIAQAHANLGEYNRANYYCQLALDIDANAAQPYHILAQIAAEKGNLEVAKSFFKRVLYLDPESISAYLHLGSIYQAENDLIRARKMLENALRLLEKLPEDSIFYPEEGIAVKAVISEVKQMLNAM